MQDSPRHSEEILTAHQFAEELEKYRQIVENASDAVVSINQNHEVVFMNRAAEKMFGYRREELMGGDLSPLIPKKHRRHHRYYVERYVRSRQERLIGHMAELEAERRDGTLFPISIGFSMAKVQGELLFTAIMRDLSAEKNLAQRVKDTEQLASVGQMVATVSHEIRTPLTLIGGFAMQLKKEAGLREGAKRKLDIIVEEVSRLEGLVNELRDLSRPYSYDWEELQLNLAVIRIKELMAPKSKKNGISLKLDLAEKLPRITADRNRLSQVLINLVNNAIQASQSGDEVLISTSMMDGGKICLEIRDQGSGIDEKNLKNIFKPFFTTKRRGTGLGLPIAQRIARDHGGSISLSSEPGQGTSARVTFPRSKVNAPHT